MWSLASFGRSFRVGIDTTTPGSLVTSGVFAFSRNPIYTAFAFILLDTFLIFPNWYSCCFTLSPPWLFHRQVLREEKEQHNVKEHYGADYAEYCRKYGDISKSRRRVRSYGAQIALETGRIPRKGQAQNMTKSNPSSPVLELRVALTARDERLVKFYCEGLGLETTQ